MMSASDYVVGQKLILVNHHGAEYPVEVVGFTSLPDDLVVRWLGLRPSLNEINTICLNHVKEVRAA